MRSLLLHQKKAFQYTRKVKHPALLMVMRSGKTLVVIRRIKADRIFEYGSLIVGPYCTLINWERELLLEGFTREDLVYLLGTRTQRVEALKKQAKFYLINKEGFLSLPEIRLRKWDNVIVDESTILKNPKSKISRFFTDNFRSVKRRWILTGSFSSESYLDIFQQLKFLNPEILQYRNYWDFRDKCFNQTSMYEYKMNETGRISLPLRLSSYCCIVGKEDLDQKIRKVYTRRVIPMSTSMRKTYETLKEEFLLEVKDKIIGETIFAIKAYTWMRRLCGGFIGETFAYTEKMDELVSLLRSEIIGSLVVWCIFKSELKEIEKRLIRERITCTTISGEINFRDRAVRIADFQNGSKRVLIAIDSCFKYSLDFSCADFAVYYSSPTGLETRQQTEARIETIHKKGVKEIIDLQMENSIECGIYESLMRKETRQELLKRIIQNEQK